jgi:hypothetical protein
MASQNAYRDRAAPANPRLVVVCEGATADDLVRGVAAAQAVFEQAGVTAWDAAAAADDRNRYEESLPDPYEDERGIEIEAEGHSTRHPRQPTMRPLPISGMRRRMLRFWRAAPTARLFLRMSGLSYCRTVTAWRLRPAR